MITLRVGLCVAWLNGSCIVYILAFEPNGVLFPVWIIGTWEVHVEACVKSHHRLQLQPMTTYGRRCCCQWHAGLLSSERTALRLSPEWIHSTWKQLTSQSIIVLGMTPAEYHSAGATAPHNWTQTLYVPVHGVQYPGVKAEQFLKTHVFWSHAKWFFSGKSGS